MIKRIIVTPYDDENRPNFEFFNSNTITKTAADKPEYVKKIMASIKPEQGFTYMLGNIVGSYEVWGSNNKGDAFEREELVPSDPNADWGYKTFLTIGAPYIEHENKDHLKVGKVILVEWIPEIERVYILVKLDNNLIDPEYLEAIKNGLVGMSMGCKIDYDVCSVCGHKARTEAERCEHIPKLLNQILPNGVKVMMMNKHPKFFDATLTLFPADRTAQMLKAASMKSSYMIKEDTTKDKKNVNPTEKKIMSDVNKLIEAGKAIQKFDIDIPPDAINSVKPDEFLALMLINNAIPKVKEIRHLKYIPDKLSSDVLKDLEIPDKLAMYLPFRSADRDSLVLRLLSVRPEFSDDQPTPKEAGLLAALIALIPAYYLLRYVYNQATKLRGAHVPPNVQLSPSTLSAITSPNLANQIAMSRLGIAPPLPSFSFSMPNTVSGLPLAYLLSRPSTTSTSKLGSFLVSELGLEELYPSEDVKSFDEKLANLFLRRIKA